jgi:hypothetical protein
MKKELGEQMGPGRGVLRDGKWNIKLILSTQLRIGLPSGLFPTNNLYAFLFCPIRATCSIHLNLLDLTILIILGKESK